MRITKLSSNAFRETTPLIVVIELKYFVENLILLGIKINENNIVITEV